MTIVLGAFCFYSDLEAVWWLEVRPDSPFMEEKPIRGYIKTINHTCFSVYSIQPVLFFFSGVELEQFGQPDKAMPSHGVARTATWELSGEQAPDVDGHVKVSVSFAGAPPVPKH